MMNLSPHVFSTGALVSHVTLRLSAPACSVNSDWTEEKLANQAVRAVSWLSSLCFTQSEGDENDEEEEEENEVSIFRIISQQPRSLIKK